MNPKLYLWHNHPCHVLVEPVYKWGIKRNALIRLLDRQEEVVVPRRALRLPPPNYSYQPAILGQKNNPYCMSPCQGEEPGIQPSDR